LEEVLLDEALEFSLLERLDADWVDTELSVVVDSEVPEDVLVEWLLLDSLVVVREDWVLPDVLLSEVVLSDDVEAEVGLVEVLLED